MHKRSVSKEVTHHIIEVSHIEDLRSDHLDAYSEMPKSKRARRTASLALSTINSVLNLETLVMSDKFTASPSQRLFWQLWPPQRMLHTSIRSMSRALEILSVKQFIHFMERAIGRKRDRGSKSGRHCQCKIYCELTSTK